MFLTNLKICGITTRETALFCARAGIGALGAVFFKPSPRYVSPQQARALFEGLPPRIARVGVFVDLKADEVIAIANVAALDTVQLHGNESPADAAALRLAGFHVVKVLKSTGKKLVADASLFPSDVGILVESGRGTLPGGNGAAWDWAAARPLSTRRPLGLAGGLTALNLIEATQAAHAAAWDVSSGVETAPGVKDHGAVTQLAFAARALSGAATGAFWKGDYESCPA